MNNQNNAPYPADLESRQLNDDSLQAVAGGAAATFSKMCPHCKKYSKFLILSKKKAVCKNCQETIDINK